eukprot:352598-Chlamydomonas_euryale.AAC.12
MPLQPQEKAQKQVDSDISTVDAALRNKLKQTEQLKVRRACSIHESRLLRPAAQSSQPGHGRRFRVSEMLLICRDDFISLYHLVIHVLQNTLHHAVVDTMNEISNCQQLKASMEHRLQKVSGKSELNGSRLDVRTGRPAREKTMDDVEVVLLQQKSLMAGFEDRVQRAISNLDREIQQLDACRRNLEADLQDKIQAIDVDSRVLGVQQDGSSAQEVFLRNTGAVQMKSPHSWVTSTDANVREARKWIADSARLRKAIRVSVQAAREQEHAISRTLNSEIMSKISITRGVKNDIEMQLKKVREEQSKVEHQRKSLAKALEAKRGPLAQAKERFNTRRAMPDRELVQDEVEAALAQEIAHLNSVTLQLANKLTAVDKTMATLDMTALTLEENLKDKWVFQDTFPPNLSMSSAGMTHLLACTCPKLCLAY